MATSANSAFRNPLCICTLGIQTACIRDKRICPSQGHQVQGRALVPHVPGVLTFQPTHTLLPSTHTSFLSLSPFSLFSPHHLLSQSLWVLAQARPSKFLIPYLLSSHLDDTPHTMDACRARPHSGSGVPPAITKEGNSSG